ncbi:MAG TPA: hypothetical protein VFY75_07950 [Solirubrobacterales bacterium]|nr:hypothetical protein [Solirubrobacterales bacterium]
MSSRLVAAVASLAAGLFVFTSSGAAEDGVPATLREGGGSPQLLCFKPASGSIVPARRPRRCVIDTVLGPTRLDLREMHWQRWDRKALGHGRLFLQDEGYPDIGGAPGLVGRVEVRLSGHLPSAPPPCYGGRWYGRAVLRVESGPERGRRIEQRLTGGCLA